MHTVSEDALARALLLMLERAKLVVEPAGVAAVAAIMEAPERFEPPVVAVLSGGNIDPGPADARAAPRHDRRPVATCRSICGSRTGRASSRQLLAQLGESGANVLDVEHQRTGPKLHLDEVEVALQLETRGETHSKTTGALRAAGYPLSVD